MQCILGDEKCIQKFSICERRKAFAMFDCLTARLLKTQVLLGMTRRWVIDSRNFDVGSSSGSSSAGKIFLAARL